MISSLAIYERSYCKCRQCRCPCEGGTPGCLAPSDLDHIADHFEVEPDEDFINSNFEACDDGPESAVDDIPSCSTPAIRPAKTQTGQCVFYSQDTGNCLIHQVAPFECSRVDQCAPNESAGAMRGLGNAIAKSTDYVMTWWWLWQKQNPEDLTDAPQET